MRASAATTPSGPHRELMPVVKTIPSDPAAAKSAFPWIAFEGRWGELQTAFFNGPTGPNMKDQWTHPIEWSQDWRDQGYAVPAGGVFGTGATDLFCGGVAKGSQALVLLLRSPTMTLLVLAALLGLIVFAVVRATWLPVGAAPASRGAARGGRSSRPRARCTSAGRGCSSGIGVLLIPLAVVITFLQWLLFRAIDLLGVVTGQGAGAFAILALVIGTTLTLLGLGLVQAVTACALVEIDAGRPIGAVAAYRLVLRRIRPLLALDRALRHRLGAAHGDGVPDPGRDLARRPLVPPRARRRARGPHGRGRPCAGAAALVRAAGSGSARSSASAPAIALIAGPLLGVALIFLTSMPFALLNVVAGVVYALALPFVAIVTAYVYFDARARGELEPAQPSELPAEIELAPS